MRALIERLEREVRKARRIGDISATLATANAAIDQLDAAGKLVPDEQTALLNAARKIAYNSAADVWPGWEIGTPAISCAVLETAQEIAEKCRELTDRVDAPAMQRGNAIWLVGAFDLARGNYGEAITQFRKAACAFEGETEARLMAQGYCAIAAELSGVAEPMPGFDTVIGKLNSIASADASAFVHQLQTGRQVFHVQCRAVT